MHKLIGVVIISLAWLAWSAGGLQGQSKGGGGGESCGLLADADLHLAEHSSLFTDDLGAAFRNRHSISVVPPSEVSIVTDQGVCGKVVPKVESDAEVDYDPSAYAVYQFGDYYGMEVAPAPSGGGGQLTGPARLYIFKAQGTKFITVIVL